MKNKIISNKSQCKKCKDIIESKYTNDLKRYTCGNIAVDGDSECIKRINNLTSNTLSIGQKLKLPREKEDEIEKKKIPLLTP